MKTCMLIIFLIVSANAARDVDVISDAGIRYKKKDIKYGKWEARMIFAHAPAMINCMYLAEPITGGIDVDDLREIDVETPGSRIDSVETTTWVGDVVVWIDAIWHYGNLCMHTDLSAGYHTYSIEWTPDYIAWGFDGRIFRRADSRDDMNLCDRLFDPADTSVILRDSTYDYDNWVKGMRDGEMILTMSLWGPHNSDTGSYWAGFWNDDNCGKAMAISWFKDYAYTPGQGPDGSDFTLDEVDDFNGSSLNDENWPQTWGNVIVRNGKAIFPIICDNEEWSDTVPVDHGDTGVCIQSINTKTRHTATGSEQAFQYTGNAVFFHLDAPGDVRIDICNMQGRIVYTKENHFAHSGSHELRLDNGILSPGAYLVNMHTKAGSQTQSIALIR